MILHLFHSDGYSAPLFISYVLEQFSSPQMDSRFVIMSNPNKDISFVHNELIEYINPKDYTCFCTFLESLDEFSAIVFHGLFYPWCECVLRSIPEHVKVAWMFWGGELYGREKRFIAPISRFINGIHSFIKGNNHSIWYLPANLFRRIDFCLTGEKEEYDYAIKYLHLEKMEHIWYTYYSIEDTVGELMTSYSNGNNVWICNSASIENNAFDAITRLLLPKNRRHLRGRKIIMPLSYGEQWVRNAIVRIGSFVFRTGFQPLTVFLPRIEYNRLFLDCSTIILPHFRPAAQGNILTALWLGMRVYLSEKSMSYLFFKRLGMRMFSFESDFSKYGCSRLSKDDVEINRMILKEWYGRKHIEEACRNVVSRLQ